MGDEPECTIEIGHWPYCAIDGCHNKCCLALDSIYCFPHTPGNKHVKDMKIDALNADAVMLDATLGDER